MTTAQAEALYLAQHNAAWGDRGWAVYNPHDKPLSDLPTIFGFNNGGGGGFLSAVLLAEDGTHLGGHGCSAEGYMPHDLGILAGARPDRHETFRAHYPDGYKMEFVGGAAVEAHAGLQLAYQANQGKHDTPRSAT